MGETCNNGRGGYKTYGVSLVVPWELRTREWCLIIHGVVGLREMATVTPKLLGVPCGKMALTTRGSVWWRLFTRVNSLVVGEELPGSLRDVAMMIQVECCSIMEMPSGTKSDGFKNVEHSGRIVYLGKRVEAPRDRLGISYPAPWHAGQP